MEVFVDEWIVRLHRFAKGTMELKIEPIYETTLVTRWGVLTDTSFLLFDNTTAELLISLDLAKLQIVKSITQPKNDPSRPFPLTILAYGSMYVHVLYISSYAQRQSWEYKINLHQRASLIP
ncbi:hypothetical protein KXD40_004306 [Peronospora effusa]|uniref:PH domain-containing protein n=1 Tax=Peronospora effusa TaxID=542832 RepID=A0A3M6VIW7_9STRA|nr:hypothetical protein DD238_004698 [Peronospora effusa]UIZ27889.1 hypothetical protein KXD40_004306 [Peronospora effusa]CAI5701095.1 unnamed protein product [Peronospora effusa]